MDLDLDYNAIIQMDEVRNLSVAMNSCIHARFQAWDKLIESPV